jgi:hypothetical protein
MTKEDAKFSYAESRKAKKEESKKVVLNINQNYNSLTVKNPKYKAYRVLAVERGQAIKSFISETLGYSNYSAKLHARRNSKDETFLTADFLTKVKKEDLPKIEACLRYENDLILKKRVKL